MNGGKRVWNRVNQALALYGLMMIFLLLSLLSSISCRRVATQPTTEPVEVRYETTDRDSTDWQTEAGGGVGAGLAKLTIGYVNNETELFRPVSYSVKLWNMGYGEPIADKAYLIAEGNYSQPTYTLTKPKTYLSYLRKVISPGWYLAEFNGSGILYKFKAIPGSDGLLVYNEQEAHAPLMSGYHAAYGRIRFSFGRTSGIGAQAFVTLAKDRDAQRIWLYGEDGVTREKSMDWFMPAGVYTGDWYKSGRNVHRVGPVTIAPGRTYPHLTL